MFSSDTNFFVFIYLLLFLHSVIIESQNFVAGKDFKIIKLYLFTYQMKRMKTREGEQLTLNHCFLRFENLCYYYQ